MTESLVNASTELPEKLTTDTIDVLFETARELRSRCRERLSVLKADIDSAFRRLPVSPAHREFAAVAFRVNGEAAVYKHNAMCFGAVSSVYHWDRIGATGPLFFWSRGRGASALLSGSFLVAIARRILHLPVGRYVDDIFGPEREGSVEHAKNVLARSLSWAARVLLAFFPSASRFAGLFAVLWVKLPSAMRSWVMATLW